MRIGVFLVVYGFALTVGMPAAAARQHEGHAAVAGGTGQSAVDVAQCDRSAVVATIEAAMQRLEEARLTNSAALLRAVADDLQIALLDVRARLTPCAASRAVALDAHAGHATAHVQHMPGAAQATAARAVVAAEPSAASHVGHASQPARTRAETPVRSRPAPPVDKPQTAAGDLSNARAITGAAAPATKLGNLKCPGKVDLKTAPRMLHQGRMYYFCSEQERAAFANEPSQHLTVPSDGPVAPVHAH